MDVLYIGLPVQCPMSVKIGLKNVTNSYKQTKLVKIGLSKTVKFCNILNKLTICTEFIELCIETRNKFIAHV